MRTIAIAGCNGITEALKRLLRGQLPPLHLKRVIDAGKMLTDPNCYLAGHRDAKDALPLAIDPYAQRPT